MKSDQSLQLTYDNEGAERTKLLVFFYLLYNNSSINTVLRSISDNL